MTSRLRSSTDGRKLLEPESTKSHNSWLAQEKELLEMFFEKRVPEALGSSEATTTLAAKDCDEYAKRHLQAEDIQRIENQGATSYILLCPSQAKIIRFHLRRLNDKVLALAHQIYGDLVPSVTFFDNFPLPVYVVPVIPGQKQYIRDFMNPAFPLERKLTTVKEIAQFVAKAAYWPQPTSSYSATSWTETARIRNHNLERIEPRFIEKARSLLTQIPLLDKLPPVLTYNDIF